VANNEKPTPPGAKKDKDIPYADIITAIGDSLAKVHGTGGIALSLVFVGLILMVASLCLAAWGPATAAGSYPLQVCTIGGLLLTLTGAAIHTAILRWRTAVLNDSLHALWGVVDRIISAYLEAAKPADTEQIAKLIAVLLQILGATATATDTLKASLRDASIESGTN